MEITTTAKVSDRAMHIASLQQRICNALQWSREDLAIMIYETGIEYLAAYLPADADGADILSRSRLFWNWWKNHWANRDAAFADSVGFVCLPPVELRELYLNQHDARTLAASIYPNGIILRESCSKLIWSLLTKKKLI